MLDAVGVGVAVSTEYPKILGEFLPEPDVGQVVHFERAGSLARLATMASPFQGQLAGTLPVRRPKIDRVPGGERDALPPARHLAPAVRVLRLGTTFHLGNQRAFGVVIPVIDHCPLTGSLAGLQGCLALLVDVAPLCVVTVRLRHMSPRV